MKTFAAVVALVATLAFAGAAGAQTYLSDWGVADMRAAIVAAGAQMTSQTTQSDGSPYLAARTPGGLKFTVRGRVCESVAPAASGGGGKRCKGALLETRFTLDSDAAVQAMVRELDYAAVSISNGGDNELLVTRYLIFDSGLHRNNLVININVFIGIAEEIWAKL